MLEIIVSPEGDVVFLDLPPEFLPIVEALNTEEGERLRGRLYGEEE